MQTKQKVLNKRASVSKLQSLGFGIVVLGAGIGVGAYVLTEIEGNLSGDAVKVTENATDALIDLASWLGILVVAAVGGIAVFFIISYMSGRGR